jgi:NAD(P)-dependent dehydrogenase (short-subunit alcohol dehydrogenase family)
MTQYVYTDFMTRGILIAGNDSSLFKAVAEEAVKRVETIAAAYIAHNDQGPTEKQIVLHWNPASPLAARTLTLAAENRLGQINEAILVCAPPPVYRPVEELLPAEVDAMVDNQIKGWFFLVRELALVFRARKAGTLVLVAPEINGNAGKDSPADILGPSVAASFRSFAQGLLASSANEPFQILGFSAPESGDETGFAAYLFKIMEESNKRNSGKWFKYGRLNLFNR